MISFIIVGLTWKWIFGDFGILNYVLTLVGAEPVHFLSDPTYANLSVIVATLWSRVGFFMVIFMAGLQVIPNDYYEAAHLDGASKLRSFWSITLPLLKPTSLLVIMISLIDAFKAYPLMFALTGGGPGRETTFIVQYIYEIASPSKSSVWQAPCRSYCSRSLPFLPSCNSSSPKEAQTNMEMKPLVRISVYTLLIVFGLFWLFPVLWVVLSAFKTNTDLYSFPPSLFPKTVTFEHFIAAFDKGNFGLISSTAPSSPFLRRCCCCLSILWLDSPWPSTDLKAIRSSWSDLFPP